MTASKKFSHRCDVVTEDLGGGISRQILAHEPSLLMARIAFESGSKGALHSHPHAQITHVLSGSFAVTVDGDERILGAGDSYYAVPGVMHGMECLSAGEVIDSFSPVREDFLSDEN
tara:strand:- start:1403 stop:1750 length:348 start_codon:yes stop_codon:yes gene_type:complete